MKKLFRSKKALSPVVAAIILIAVTVAVSLAVAAWMGALTFTFMKSEELKITRAAFSTSNSTLVTVYVTNTGTSSLTVTSAEVDSNSATITSSGGSFTESGGQYTLNKGQSGTLTIYYSSGFTSGYKYTITLTTSTGNKYSYTATKP